MDEFALVIPGKAHGQGRARSGQGRVYTPAATREHAAKVQTEWIAAGRPTLPEGYHYAARLVSYRARPASHYTSKGELSAVGKRSPVPGKPDCDNEIKGVIDALVACGAVPDDARCFDWHAIKVWAQRGEPERVWVEFDARWFLARSWRDAPVRNPGVIEALEAEGVPTKLAYAKVEHLIHRGILECGVSPRYAWPTDAADEAGGA